MENIIKKEYDNNDSTKNLIIYYLKFKLNDNNNIFPKRKFCLKSLK